jgi:hypothetical protein
MTGKEAKRWLHVTVWFSRGILKVGTQQAVHLAGELVSVFVEKLQIDFDSSRSQKRAPFNSFYSEFLRERA